MYFPKLDAQSACAALARIGIPSTPSEVRVEARLDRWLVRLPGNQLAWFAATTKGHRRLQRQRRVLRLLSARCRFTVPSILVESPQGEYDVRSMVAGTVEPSRVFERARNDLGFVRSLGHAIGELLAEQHTRVVADDAAAWLPDRAAWPQAGEVVLDRLTNVVSDPDLLSGAHEVMDAYERISLHQSECVLTHTDVGFHNLGIDLDGPTLHGIFDYDEAAWTDRHQDFRYLILDAGSGSHDLLDAASAVYAQRTGIAIEPTRVVLYHAACALAFLAYRSLTAPAARSCGRTLEEDLGWSRAALARFRESQRMNS